MKTAPNDWKEPPPGIALTGGTVHLWRASLALPADLLSRLSRLLSDAERARAERFLIERDRARFIASHGVLRLILGRYIARSPGELRFERGPHGKPALAEGAGEEGIEFNMAHSAELALYAVTRGRPVGVDVERIREELDWERVARRFFHPNEAASLRALPEGTRRRAFFSYWSCKEAYIKARGEGLSIRTGSFAVRVVPGERAGIELVPGEPGEAARWSLFEIEPGPGYAGAVAVRGKAARVERWEWSGGAAFF